MTLHSKSLISIAVALGVAASALPAFAQGETVSGVTIRAPRGALIRSELVRLGDLDLNNGHDYRIMLSRVRAAAWRVCSPEPSTYVDLRQVYEHDACVRPAINHALSQIEGPRYAER